MKKALVLGAGGFIGSHMVKRLKKEGYGVCGVDLKYPEFGKTEADEFIIGDLRNPLIVKEVMLPPNQNDIGKGSFDEVYQFAADMGGIKILFYSSSACIYPKYNQMDPNNPKLSEDSAYPAAPDSEYGWEKLFSERLYFTFHKNLGLNIKITRFHNIFGPEGTWEGGKEKAPAALCRKVIEAKDGDFIEVWGDGKQTRSFLYIDECLEAVRRLMDSDFMGPVNIGSEEMISINNLVRMIIGISGKNLNIKNIEGPEGVRGRNSDNKLYREKIGWEVSQPLKVGIEKTYRWIEEQVKSREN